MGNSIAIEVRLSVNDIRQAPKPTLRELRSVRRATVTVAIPILFVRYIRTYIFIYIEILLKTSIVL